MFSNIEKWRANLLHVAIPVVLQNDLEYYRRLEALRHSAMLNLGTAVQCFMVGFEDNGRLIASRCRERLLLANEIGETPKKDYFPGGTESLGFQDLALCNWLLDGIEDLESYRHAIAGEERWWTLKSSEMEIEPIDADAFVRIAVEAELYDKGIDFYVNRAGLKPPVSWSQAKRAASAAYLLCLAGLEGRQNDPRIISGMEAFFAREVINLIVRHGWFAEMAHWAKIVYWNAKPNAQTPGEALRRVLEIPGVISKT